MMIILKALKLINRSLFYAPSISIICLFIYLLFIEKKIEENNR